MRFQNLLATCYLLVAIFEIYLLLATCWNSQVIFIFFTCYLLLAGCIFWNLLATCYLLKFASYFQIFYLLLATCYLLSKLLSKLLLAWKKLMINYKKLLFCADSYSGMRIKFKSGLRFMLGGGKINQLERKGLCDFWNLLASKLLSKLFSKFLLATCYLLVAIFEIYLLLATCWNSQVIFIFFTCYLLLASCDFWNLLATCYLLKFATC